VLVLLMMMSADTHHHPPHHYHSVIPHTTSLIYAKHKDKNIQQNPSNSSLLVSNCGS
jgi:hypothetical protein